MIDITVHWTSDAPGFVRLHKPQPKHEPRRRVCCLETFAFLYDKSEGRREWIETLAVVAVG